jgi:hypothetical protein
MYWLPGRSLEVTLFLDLFSSDCSGRIIAAPIMQLDVRDPIEDKPVLVWRNPLDVRQTNLNPVGQTFSTRASASAIVSPLGGMTLIMWLDNLAPDIQEGGPLPAQNHPRPRSDQRGRHPAIDSMFGMLGSSLRTIKSRPFTRPGCQTSPTTGAV